jgi:RNA polymerase sigma-70 factor (ECF subfamily)
LLERGLARADREQGSFRAFLVTLVRRFAVNENERERALVRGGALQHVPLDFADGDDELCASSDTPEQSFDRAWARALLAHTLATLRAEHSGADAVARFAALEPLLVPGAEPPDSASLAATLGVPESTARVIVFRARRRYRDVLRAAVAETLVSREDVDAELAALLAALAG